MAKSRTRKPKRRFDPKASLAALRKEAKALRAHFRQQSTTAKNRRRLRALSVVLNATACGQDLSDF